MTIQIDPDSLDFDDIVGGAARALFVSAYMEAADETMCPTCEAIEWPCKPDCSDVDHILELVPRYPDLERAGAGEDWMDVAPCTPPAATVSAQLLLARTAGLAARDHNEPTAVILQRLCKDWIQCGGNSIGHEGSAEEVFGHYLAMQALGSGVGLSDDISMDAGYKSPHLPFLEAFYIGGKFSCTCGIDGEFSSSCGTARDAAKGEG